VYGRPLVRALALVAVIAGCKFAPPSASTDALGDDGASNSDGQGSCLEKWRAHSVVLDAPTKLAELSTTNTNVEPWISPDGLSLVFVQEEMPNKGEIMVATRSTTDQPFGSILPSDLSNPTSDESKASFVADYSLAVFSSDLDLATNKGETDLYAATRQPASDPNGDWSTPSQAMFELLNTSGKDQDPWLNADGSRLYLSIDPGGPTTKSYLAVSTRSTGLYVAHTILVNSNEGDQDPTLSPDERVLVFTSTRGGGVGKRDLWYATRDSATAGFTGDATHLAAINSSEEDEDPALSADGCTLYFVSSRDGGRDLFVAQVQ